MGGYFTLTPRVGFLTDVDTESGTTTSIAQLSIAELRAKAHIDGVLGKTFSTDQADAVSGTPVLIMEIAEMLAAAKVRKKFFAGNPDGLTAAQKIEDDAHEMLTKIRGGITGIQLRNGAWDPQYPGANNRTQGRGGGSFIVVCG